MDSETHRRECLEEAPTQREDADMMVEAETGVMLPHAKGSSGATGARRSKEGPSLRGFREVFGTPVVVLCYCSPRTNLGR